jgi:hypothetical protein
MEKHMKGVNMALYSHAIDLRLSRVEKLKSLAVDH